MDENGFVTYVDGDNISLVGYLDTKNDIIVPEGVTSIFKDAFYSCSSLISITLPSSLTAIESNAFSSCVRLVEIINKSSLNIVEGSRDNGCVAQYAKQVITDKNQSKLNTDDSGLVIYDNTCIVGYIGESKDIIIPNTVTIVNDYAFYDLSFVVTVFIPKSVITIGESAFAACFKLTIRCELTSKPSGWADNWNGECPVVWGYTGS